MKAWEIPSFHQRDVLALNKFQANPSANPPNLLQLKKRLSRVQVWICLDPATHCVALESLWDHHVGDMTQQKQCQNCQYLFAACSGLTLRFPGINVQLVNAWTSQAPWKMVPSIYIYTQYSLFRVPSARVQLLDRPALPPKAKDCEALALKVVSEVTVTMECPQPLGAPDPQLV